MKCLLCAREIFNENEAVWINDDNAVCPQCALLAAKKELEDPVDTYSETKKNSTGSIMQIVAFILWILGGISVVSFCILIKNFSFSAMMIGLFAAFTSGLLVYGLGEIIILLGQINDKLKNKKG